MEGSRMYRNTFDLNTDIQFLDFSFFCFYWISSCFCFYWTILIVYVCFFLYIWNSEVYLECYITHSVGVLCMFVAIAMINWVGVRIHGERWGEGCSISDHIGRYFMSWSASPQSEFNVSQLMHYIYYIDGAFEQLFIRPIFSWPELERKHGVRSHRTAADSAGIRPALQSHEFDPPSARLRNQTHKHRSRAL